MSAPALRSTIPSRQRFITSSWPAARRLVAWIALPFLLVAGNAAGQPQPCTGCNTTGVWTTVPNIPGAYWGYQQVHLALLRGGNVGGVDYHSYLISWEITGGSTNRNGLYGWKPGDPGYNAYPGDDHLKFLHLLPDPGVNLFCAGHSTLSDGRLLVSGGHVGHDVGIVDWRIFDPATRAWITPPPSDTMKYARWYGTDTTLPSGQVLTTSGSRFFRSLAFGGSPDPASPAPSNNDLRPGQLSPDIVWEAATAGSPDPLVWPAAREGHTAAWLGNYGSMVVFGGRGTNGFLRKDTWRLEYGQEVTGPSAGSYVIKGVKEGDGPGNRYGHVATANYDGDFMLVHGGKDETGIVPDQVYRFAVNDVTEQWEWNALNPQGSPPGGRWGHAAAWDNDNMRMIVFGGRDQSGLADNNTVYTLKETGAPPVWTWTAITVTGGPSKREGHTLVWDSVRRTRPHETGKGGEWERGIVFGGQDAGGVRKNDAWILWNKVADPAVWEWQAGPAAPTELLPRTRHASFWDLGGERFIIVGGDTGGASAADFWQLRVTAPTPTVVHGLEWVPNPFPQITNTPALVGQTIVRVGSELAAEPEQFSPQAGPYGQYVDVALQPETQPAYPPMFVLPSGNLLYPASNNWTKILNLNPGPNQNKWTNIVPLNNGDDEFFGEAAVMYLPGKVMKTGGDDYDDPRVNPTATLALDLADVTSGWVAGDPMSGPKRHHHNLTILPDGKVLVTGGGNLKPELWDPDRPVDDWWTGYDVLAPNSVVRDYHATVLLLPDGRVLTAGASSDLVTIFSPPYLFDAQGNFAPRPAILEAPCTVAYGASNTFEVRTSDIAGMQAGGKVALMRAGSVTHAFDMNQRYVPLNFTICGDRLRIEAPANANLAPPGDYLLFLVNGSGVPSVASWLRVGASPLAGCDGVIPSQAGTPVPEIISDTEVWMYWSGAADDAPSTGTVTAYEVRRSGQAINDEAAFCAAPVAAGQAVPATPLEPPLGYQYWRLPDLTPNTTYHVALKARDEKWNWGPVSASVSVTTLPTGGGGGGGGLSAREVTGDGLLRAGAAGAQSGIGAPVAEVPSAEGQGGGDGRGTGTLSSEPMALVSRAGEPLAVEMRLEAGRPVWTIRHLDAAAAADLTGTDGATLILQVPGGDGAWQTRARFQPGSGSSRFGLRSAERTRRFVFLGQVGLELAAPAVEAAAGGVWTLADARHSQLGDVTPVVQATGGYDLGLLTGETLTLTYEPGTVGNEPVTDCFVFVSPNGTSTGLANRGRNRLGEAVKLPTAFALHQNQPNPFARTTTIRFDLATESEVRLALFDAQGRRVRTLASGTRPAGFHTLEWDRRDDAGREVEAGVYLYRLEAGAFRAQRKVVLLP